MEKNTPHPNTPSTPGLLRRSRRNDRNLHHEVERAIIAAIRAVEDAGADPLLTEAVILLDRARNHVAQWVDRGIAATGLKLLEQLHALTPAARLAVAEFAADPSLDINDANDRQRVIARLLGRLGAKAVPEDEL